MTWNLIAFMVGLTIVLGYAPLLAWYRKRKEERALIRACEEIKAGKYK